MSVRAVAAPLSELPWLRVSADAVTIELIVRSSASRSGIRTASGRGLIVDVHAAPERGKANNETIETIAKSLGIPRSAITIIRGETSRHKTLRIRAAEPIRISNLLCSIANPSRSSDNQPRRRNDESLTPSR